MSTVEQNTYDPRLGYELKNAGVVGKLDINFLSKPSNMHYDPEQISIPTPEDTRKILARTSLLHLPQTPVLMPGSIMLNDRKDKRVGFTTFGGRLQVTPYGENVTVEIVSNGAPILDKRESTSADAIVAAEFESMMARSRAQYIQRLCQTGATPRAAELEFNTNVVKIAPAIHFESFLITTLASLEEHKGLRDVLKEPFQEFVHAHENCIGALESANDIFYLASTKVG